MSNSDKGFGSMPDEKVQDIAKKGGETTHKDNQSHNKDEKDQKDQKNDNSKK